MATQDLCRERNSKRVDGDRYTTETYVLNNLITLWSSTDCSCKFGKSVDKIRRTLLDGSMGFPPDNRAVD